MRRLSRLVSSIRRSKPISEEQTFNGESSVVTGIPEINVSSTILPLEETEEDLTPPRHLLSLPVETVLQIIEYLPYLDRFHLKLAGKHELVSIIQLCQRPTFKEYLNGYESIDGTHEEFEQGKSRSSVMVTLDLACSKGHDALVSKLAKEELLNPKRRRRVNQYSRLDKSQLHKCLERAVISSQVSTVKLLLGLGAKNLNDPIGDSQSRYAMDELNALEYASMNGNNEIIQLLFNHGAYIRFRDYHTSAVGFAARQGHESSVKLLVSRIHEDKARKLSPALLEAAASGHAPIVEYLLDGGAKVLPSPCNPTALHLTAKGGHLECLQIMLEHGINDSTVTYYDPLSRIHHQDWSCLHFAAFHGHHKVVKYLLDGEHIVMNMDSLQTVVPIVAMTGQLHMIGLLLDRGFKVYGKYLGQTALHHAVMNDHPRMITMLLENGARARSSYGGREMQTPLHKAAITGSSWATSLLLDFNADVNAQDLNGETPLHISVLRGHHLVTEILLKAGANVHILNMVNRSALNIAIKQNHEFCISLLLDYKADMSHGTILQDSVLHSACYYGHPNTVSMLLSYGADAEAQDTLGRRPIHAAANCGDTGCLLHLLTADVDRHARSKDGKTALHYATEAGNLEAARLLLEWGLDRDAKDAKGLTPLISGPSSHLYERMGRISKDYKS